ncbi:hypothetical protein ACNKHU_03135 [Shigella flexneri]
MAAVGIANQMLAGMALMLCAVVCSKMKRRRLRRGWRWYRQAAALDFYLTAGWRKRLAQMESRLPGHC